MLAHSVWSLDRFVPRDDRLTNVIANLCCEAIWNINCQRMLITGLGSSEQGKNVWHLCELLVAQPVESLDCFVPRNNIFSVIANLCCDT